MVQRIKNLYHLLEAFIANCVFLFPSRHLTVLAITGTDGKTTSASLLYHVLKEAGYKVALISTVAAYLGDTQVDTGFHVTTPSSFALQRLLARIVRQRCTHVVLEVTSHGIDQNRVWGIRPQLAGATNVTHEHLDYHRSFAAYLATKARLLLSSTHAFINEQAGESFEPLQKILLDHHAQFTKYTAAGFSTSMRKAVEKRFGAQQYNAQNAALVYAMATHLGIDEKVITKAVTSFPHVPGRMEAINNSRGIRIIVDFAHTPNALEGALRSVRAQLKQKKGRKKGSLIVVFGCAGERDVKKRPKMGEIAASLADYVILTAEDPRTEDVWSIIGQIKSGVTSGHKKLISIADRYQALVYAINHLAARGDTVLVTGKGHEKSMCFGTMEYPWSDQEAIREILEGVRV